MKLYTIATIFLQSQIQQGVTTKVHTFCIEGFRPKFRLPTGVNLSVTAMCKLSLLDLIIDGIVIRSNTYTLERTTLEEKIMVNGVMKRNPRRMHPKKYQDITQRDILYFFACYYYMGYYKLPARQDYWAQR